MSESKKAKRQRKAFLFVNSDSHSNFYLFFFSHRYRTRAMSRPHSKTVRFELKDDKQVDHIPKFSLEWLDLNREHVSQLTDRETLRFRNYLNKLIFPEVGTYVDPMTKMQAQQWIVVIEQILRTSIEK
jgi:hypothetical protein